jgi:beta-phosphoglucomutase-like phosphatase (HAD superfamily)
MPIAGLIFDFDGVIADSETLANTVLAETVTELGLPTTLDDSLARYMGRRWPEAMALIETGLGRPLPGTFSEDLKAATLARFRTDLAEIAGAGAFIRRSRPIFFKKNRRGFSQNTPADISSLP